MNKGIDLGDRNGKIVVDPRIPYGKHENVVKLNQREEYTIWVG